MAKKKLAFLMFTLALGELAFSFWHPHHEIGAIEALEGFTVFLAGVALYATDVHKFVLSVSQTMYKSVELKSLNAFNYGIASFFKRLSEFMYENIAQRHRCVQLFCRWSLRIVCSTFQKNSDRSVVLQYVNGSYWCRVTNSSAVPI